MTGVAVPAPAVLSVGTSIRSPALAGLGQMKEVATMSGDDREALWRRVEQAYEDGDRASLRRLAELGHSDATDALVELATEAEDLAELARLAEAGSKDARDVLAELTGEFDG